MNDDIKPGDVCEVVGACCESARRFYGGKECTVLRVPGPLTMANGCTICQWTSTGTDAFVVDFPDAPAWARGKHVFERRWLRKKPPKARDDAEPRDDFVPAIDSKWADIGWHPNKTKETA